MFKNLKLDLAKELFSVQKYIGLSRDEIYKMPTYERKLMIKLHNEVTENEKMMQSAAVNKGRGGGRK